MDRLQIAVARAKEKNRMRSSDRSYVLESDEPTETAVMSPIEEKELADRRILAGIADSPLSATFRLLRTKVMSQMRANGWKTIAVSSPTAGQGKSTVAANLAIAMAMEVTQSVLIVDLDLQRPNLHRVLGVKPETGLTDVLQGKAKVKDALINIGIERLTVFPGRGSVSSSSEWLSDPSMQQLFAEFRANKSRFVVYDMPPLLQSDDVLKSVKNFDCLLMVVEDGYNSSDGIRQSMEVLERTNFIGYVLNKSASGYPFASVKE